MLLHNLLLLSISSAVKGYLFNISIGIINAQTVIACGPSTNIYSSFNSNKIMMCPYVSIQQKNIQLIKMKIIVNEKKELNVSFSPKLISSPEVWIKPNNNSLIRPSNFTEINTYYLSFSPQLTCRYSSLKHTTICFYYPLSINFIQIEHYFDKITNLNPLLTNQKRYYSIIIFIVIGTLLIILCLCALFIFCTSRVPFQHTIQLDYIIDPQLAKEAALKLSPEPV